MAPSVRALPGKIEFNRPPRLRGGLSRTRVEVPTAPPTPHETGSSLASGLIIPIVVVAAMSGVFLVASGSADPAQRGFMLLAGGGLLVGSALAPAWAFFEDRRRFRRQIARQQDEYSRRLRNLEPELDALRDEEYTLRLADDPEPAVLLERARTATGALGTPSSRPRLSGCSTRPGPGAERIGGGAPRGCRAESEPSPLIVHLSALKRAGAQLAERHRHIADVPIRADLKAVGALAIVGSRRQTGAVARAVLCQAASLQSRGRPADRRGAGRGLRRRLDLVEVAAPRASESDRRQPTPARLEHRPARADLSRWLLDELTGRKRVLSEVAVYDAPQLNLAWILLFVDDVSALRTDRADA